MTEDDYQDIYHSVIFQRDIELQELREKFRIKIKTEHIIVSYDINERFYAAIATIYAEEVAQEQAIKAYFRPRYYELIETKAPEEETESYLSYSRGVIIEMLLNNREEAHGRSLYYIEQELFLLPPDNPPEELTERNISPLTAFALQSNHNNSNSIATDNVEDIQINTDEEPDEVGAFIVFPAAQENTQTRNLTDDASEPAEAEVSVTKLSGEEMSLVGSLQHNHY